MAEIQRPHGCIGCAFIIGIVLLCSFGAALQVELNKRRKVERRPLNLDSYCRSYHGDSAVAVGTAGDAFAWRCKVENLTKGIQYFEISMDEACRLQYGREFRATVDDRKDFESWHCIPK